MSFEETTGDLFAQRDVAALGQGVNCEGVMGRGIAAEFSKRFPDMFKAYARACRAGELTVGGFFPWQLPNGRWIYNLATQDRKGRDARLDAVESSLRLALEHAVAHDVPSMALPHLGAGIGGLAWADVRQVVAQLTEPSPVLVRTVAYQPRR